MVEAIGSALNDRGLESQPSHISFHFFAKDSNWIKMGWESKVQFYQMSSHTTLKGCLKDMKKDSMILTWLWQWLCITFDYSLHAPFFTVVYNQERLILQTIYVLNKEILLWNPWFIIKSGFKSRTGFNGTYTVRISLISTNYQLTFLRSERGNYLNIFNF